MIGPQAYENLFQTTPPEVKTLDVFWDGSMYSYDYDWEVLEFFDGFANFKAFCIDDVEHNEGSEADRIGEPQ